MNDTVAVSCYTSLLGEFQLPHLGVLLSFVVLTLNMLIIVTILRTKALHTNTNIFIASVALFDCLMALSDITNGILYSTGLKYKLQATISIDTVEMGIWYGAATFSCSQMAIIAIDRYISIVHPFYYILHISKRRIMAVMFVAWLFGLAYCNIPVMFYRDDKYHKFCIASHPPLEYFITSAFFNFVDYVIIFTCYFKIAHVAFKHKKAFNARKIQHLNANVVKLQNNRTAAIRSIKFFVCMFGCFFICTFPQILTVCLILLSYNIPEKISLGILYLYEVHSLVNFLIYFHLNKDFSNGLKRFLLDVPVGCRKCKTS